MRNEVFRKLAYWSAFSAVIVALINIVMCVVKTVKLYNTELKSDFLDVVIYYPPEMCTQMILYKISIGILVFSALMMIISFLVNNSGVLKTIMIICRIAQLICLVINLIDYFVIINLEMFVIVWFVFLFFELIALILYIIDSNHRRTLLRIIIFAIMAAGIGVVYMLLWFCVLLLCLYLLIKIVLVICGNEEAKQPVLKDKFGNVVYWFDRQ
jgi:hypothetical protein